MTPVGGWRLAVGGRRTDSKAGEAGGPPPTANRQPPTILIADNDPNILSLYERALLDAGFEVLTAETEQQAEALFAGHDIRLAVLDLLMEHPDAGIVLAHHFKRDKPHVPILMTSTLTADTGMVFTLASRGERKWIKADRILTKPVRLDRLVEEARTLLEV